MIKTPQLIKITLLAALTLLTGCIKDEPLNAECDILEVSVSVPHPDEVFFHASDSLLRVYSDENTIQFNVRNAADLRCMAPWFKISEGAAIMPENGSEHDFSSGPVTYTVTSQDGQWQRQYQVLFKRVTVTVTDTVKYDFEHYQLDETYHKYYTWFEESSNGPEPVWATGNPGYFIPHWQAEAMDYPSTPSNDGLDGSCIKLTTRDTGTYGVSSRKPIAAGNMFLGKFIVDKVMTETLKSTEMGIPFTMQPEKVTGYYKYQPGPVFKDKYLQIAANRTDSANIYAVLYRNHDAEGNSVHLYGDNVLTSDLIVRKAVIDKVKTTSEWTYFEMPFQQLSDIDEDLLQNRGYNLTLVFSSSKYGDTFEGAVGSTLYIDKVRIICAHNE